MCREVKTKLAKDDQRRWRRMLRMFAAKAGAFDVHASLLNSVVRTACLLHMFAVKAGELDMLESMTNSAMNKWSMALEQIQARETPSATSGSMLPVAETFEVGSITFPDHLELSGYANSAMNREYSLRNIRAFGLQTWRTADNAFFMYFARDRDRISHHG